MDAPEINAAVIVLAAGDSTRMGTPKALLDWHGKPLIDHVLDTARAGGCTRLHVVLGKDAAAIRAGAQLADANVIVNLHPEQGQVSSLKLAFQQQDFSTDCCVCWPVDVPLVNPGDVRALIDAYARWRASLMRIFIPTYKGKRGHPMLVDIGFRQPFMELKAEQNARKVIEDNPTQVKEVEVSNEGVLIDIDTPDEYRAALGPA
ncbi:MAG: nucleotidyltransferase family protein [Planctomycetes bacterium]|nr:nucleotidyltransferase family protein [Planctomycetota bacterium]MCW8135534.1 nucleotidyltransferase family protein [Planctomycetota bacterium]